MHIPPKLHAASCCDCPQLGAHSINFDLTTKLKLMRRVRSHVVDDTSALVQRRHLARADVKGSYAASRLIGLCRYFKSCIAGFALRPRFSPLCFSAQPEKTAFKSFGFRHLQETAWTNSEKLSASSPSARLSKYSSYAFFISNSCLLLG